MIGFVVKCVGDLVFVDVVGFGDQVVLMVGDLVVGYQVGDECVVQFVWCMQVDVFDVGVLLECSKFQLGCELFGVVFGCFVVGYDVDVFFEVECGQIGCGVLFFEGFSYVGEVECDQVFMGGMGEYWVFFGLRISGSSCGCGCCCGVGVCDLVWV